MTDLLRACWVDAGNDPDPVKLKAHGVTAPVFDIREPRLNLRYLTTWRAQFAAVGVYAAWNWNSALTGPEFATWVSRRLQVIAPNTAPDFPFVCLDMETDNVAYLTGASVQWRKHRPDRVTDWTLEGHKGGIFTDHPAARIILSADFRYIVPQCYNGALTQLWDTFAMTKDLVDAGFPFQSIRPFYDAAHLPEWWDGYAFTQGRLP